MCNLSLTVVGRLTDMKKLDTKLAVYEIKQSILSILKNPQNKQTNPETGSSGYRK